jgi:hypothetical protein
MSWEMTPDGPQEHVVVLRPLRAMREKCLDCCCGQAFEVKECPCTGCSLWPYRMGRSPNRKGIPRKPMTDAHKQRLFEGRARALALRRPPASE